MVSIEKDDRKIGLVFELVSGGELYDSLVKQGAYSEDKASQVVRQVASAMSFMHNKCHLVHGDLKPENLLLRDNNFEVAICDFGCAVNLDEKGEFSFNSKTMMGTVAYSAPELLKPPPSFGNMFRTRASTAVDVWSLGCVLYVLLSGTHPFDVENELSDAELEKAILKGHYDFSSPVWRDVSESAKNLISRMLERNPKKRITATEILEHDWIKKPQTKDVISGSDVRLRGYLQTQRRVQNFVFNMMIGGHLKKRMEEAGNNDRVSTDALRSIDTEGKGYITGRDLERTLSTGKHGAMLKVDNLPSFGKAVETAKLDTENPSAVAAVAAAPALPGKPNVLEKSDSSTTATDEPPSPETEEDDKLYYSSLGGLVGCGEHVTYAPGAVVFSKGDAANSFYFVDRGKVEVEVTSATSAAMPPALGNVEGEGASATENPIAVPSLPLALDHQTEVNLVQIGAGDFFGETALIKNQPRNATVRAGPKGAELICFSKEDFQHLIDSSSENFAILNDQIRKRAVEHVKYVFSSMFHDYKTNYIGHGAPLLKRGDVSDSMYYIADGVFDIVSKSGQVVAERREGETVGELGLITGEKRSMDVVCSTKTGCAVKRLTKDDVKRLLEFSPDVRTQLDQAMTSRVEEEFQNRKNDELRKMFTRMPQGMAVVVKQPSQRKAKKEEGQQQ